MNPSFTISDCIDFGWRTFKARLGFFIGLLFVVVVVLIASTVTQALVVAVFGKFLGKILAIPISLVVNVFIGIGIQSVFLKAHDAVMAPTLSDLWRPRLFAPYLLTYLLVLISVGVGLLLLIVPGIIIALMLSFATLLVVDRGLGPIEAFKESARITKGHRLHLFLLVLVLALLNIVGALVLLVGLLISAPVSGLAFIHAYRALSSPARSSADVPAAVPAAA